MNIAYFRNKNKEKNVVQINKPKLKNKINNEANAQNQIKQNFINNLEFKQGI